MKLTEIQLGAIVAALAFAAGASSGWMVNGWRLGAQIEQLAGVVATQQQSLETLKGANQRCTAGVADVRKSLEAFYGAIAARTAAVEAAMKAAERASRAHQEAARQALARPAPKPGEECASAAREAAAYAAKRKGAP
jgi:hypothetical protein